MMTRRSSNPARPIRPYGELRARMVVVLLSLVALCCTEASDIGPVAGGDDRAGSIGFYTLLPTCLAASGNFVGVRSFDVLLSKASALSPEPIEVRPVKLSVGAATATFTTADPLATNRAWQRLG